MRRSYLLPVFLAGLAWSFEASLQPLTPVLTEEGQHVLFGRQTFARRELAKRLPLAEPWPENSALSKTLERFGLGKSRLANSIPMPAKLATGVYLVGQDRITNLTYLLDCGPDGVAIIDPTFESEVDRTLANVEKCGFSPKKIRWVINTHCHVDHAMADKKYRQLGAEIIVHEDDAAAIEKGTRVTGYYSAMKPMGIKEFPPSKVDRRLSDGEELRLGDKLLHVIHTPGHTPGSACFLLQADGKNLLFSGDTVFYDNMLGAQGNPYADNHKLLASLDKLRRFSLDATPFRFDVLLPGHGAVALDLAYLDIQKDRDTLAGDIEAGRDVQVTPHSRPEYRLRMFGRPATPPVVK